MTFDPTRTVSYHCNSTVHPICSTSKSHTANLIVHGVWSQEEEGIDLPTVRSGDEGASGSGSEGDGSGEASEGADDDGEGDSDGEGASGSSGDEDDAGEPGE